MNTWACLVCGWVIVLHASAITVDFTLEDFSDSYSSDYLAAQLQTDYGVTQASITPLTEGTISVQSCTAGTYAQTGTGQCVACVAGKYSTDLNAMSESVCIQCGAGTYSTVVGATTGQTCQACLEGTYNPSYGSNSSGDCLPCPANSSSINGSTHIQACVCNPGFSGMNGDTCTGCNTTSWCLNGQLNPCPPHSISRALSYDVRQCLCKPGYFGDTGLGLVDTSLYPLLCQFCKEDHFCPGGAVNVSYVCPDGKYSLPGSDESTDCNCPEFASSQRNSQNSSQCICGAGYRKVYKVNSPIGGWVCELCGPNDYCYSDQAFTCPPHSSSVAGSDALLDCFCDPGYQNATIQNTSQLCDNCEANYFCTGKGAKQQCTTHAVSPTQSPDAGKCYCDWGYKGLNNSACVACASPKYCYGGVEATCVEDSSSVPLAWSLLNCSCNPGRWGPAGGPCVKCGTGKYKLAQGCSACSATVDDDCLVCDAGTFSSTLGRTQVCDGCGAGTFALTGATECGECSAGTFSGARASVCTYCVLGQYSPTGATTCGSCGPGKYLDVPGQASSSNCKLCPAGSFTVLEGTNISSCYSCSRGTTSELQRQLAVTANIPSVSGQLAATDISISNDFTMEFTLGDLSQPNAQGNYEDIMFIASADQVQTYVEILYDASGLLVSVGRGCQLVMPLNASVVTWAVRISLSGGTMFGWVNGVHVATSVTCTVLATNAFISTTAGLTIGGMAPPSSGTVSLVTLTTTIGNTECASCPVNTYAEPRFSACFPCPPYSTSGVGSGMADCICDANYELKNTSVLYAGGPTFLCSPCSQGSTSTRGGTCQTCSPGSYQVGLDCEECGAGTFASNGATVCGICGPGTYSARRSGECTQCAAGKYNPYNGSMACISCDAGYYSLSGADNCSACDSGFISLGGSSSCFACPTGQYAASGASQCSLCIPGTWSNTSIGSVLECASCGFGKYSTNLGANTSGVCKLCSAGTFSPETIAPDVNSCAECAAGSFAKAGSSFCGVCQNGTYSLQRAGECLGCSQGTYSSSFSSVCSLCQPGTFSEIANGTSSQVCQECENGTFSNKTGASSHLACIWCLAGEYAHAGATACSICQNETYSSTHAGSCLGCPEFSDALPGSSLSGCICRAGFRYNRSQSVFTCDSCPLGAWSARNAEQCNLCPVGKASATPRAVDVSTCLTCSGGKFTPTPGYSVCLSCPPGSFSPDGASSCQNCTQGSWAAAASPNCTVCKAGRYSTTLLAGSDAACIGCASGKFSVTAGATSESTCQTCPVGSRSGMGSGSTSCDSCPANTYADPETDGCMACPVNSTSVPGSDMNGCVCNGGQRTYYKSRGSGGSMSYFLNETSGGVFMQHEFTSGGTWMLDMFLQTTVRVICDGIPDPSDNIVWTRGLRDARQVFSCTQNLTVIYQVDGPFSLNVSTAYFKCETCNAGFYSYKGMDSCISCPAGTFQDTPGSPGIESCRSCGQGSITPSAGASQCVKCEQGTYQATLTACLQCTPGTYALAEKTSCSTCPRDYWSDAGSSQCQPCPLHSNSSNGSALSGCLCLPGYHHVGLINSSGEIDMGNFTCEGCRAGYYSGSNYSSCLPCGTGFYSDTLSGACSPCASGTYQPLLAGANVSSCLACPAGSNANAASAECAACPPSYYCTGAGMQEPCPLGSYSPDSGLQNASACPLCPANSFCVDTLTLEYCPANTYSTPGTTTKLQCLCDPGYTCTYKKAIKAVVTLPLTEAQFEMVRDEFLQAVADAAGVTVDKVAIINVRPRPVANRRRLLSLSGNSRGGRRHNTGDVKVNMHIKEAHTIETLDRHLAKRGIPKSSEVNVRHRHMLLVAPTRILQYI